ncbi:hypothetical protein DFH28DRAFT_1140347 [Melampsora americana]|nr:hypothetical protein DFH28DRAFT_1140347 [Melampsora americana]
MAMEGGRKRRKGPANLQDLCRISTDSLVEVLNRVSPKSVKEFKRRLIEFYIVSKQRKGSANTKRKSSRQHNRGHQPTPDPDTTTNTANDTINPQTSSNNEQSTPQTSLNDQQKTKQFISSFPSLAIDNMEQELDKWTVVNLQKALAEQKKRYSRHKNQVPSEIEDLVELIRLDHKKRMLMAALIGGISEAVVWSLVNVGPTSGKSSCWTRFLSLGKKPLAITMSHRNDKPGWAKQNKDIREIWDNMSIDQKMVFKTPYFFALAKLPDLSRPSAVVELGNDGQDIDKEDISAEVTSPPVHQLSEEDELLYRPIFEELVDVEKSTTQSRKARNECFNNQPPAQIISGLLSCSSQDEHIPEKVFPKKDDPAGVIKSQGWPIRLVLKRPDSALLPEELDLGFRLCDDGQKKKWLSDIKNGLFYIEKIPPSEFVPPQKGNKKRKRPTSTTANQDTSSNQTTTETSSTS